MVDQTLLPAITATIRANEIGGGSPYELEYACKDKSGASFGFMQGDTNANDLARQTLRNVFAAAGVPPADAERILAAVCRGLPNGNPLTAADAATANGALASDAGRPLVDAMDQALMQHVLNDLDRCEAAAATRGQTLSGLAHLFVAPWINMTGAPTTLVTWLKGAAINGIPAPAGPEVEGGEVSAYLHSQSYFQNNPKNFKHYVESVNAGAPLLPA
jgi:hypothetical protein